MHIKPANSNLSEHDGGFLNFKKKVVWNREFFYTGVFYRPDGSKNRNFSQLNADTNWTAECMYFLQTRGNLAFYRRNKNTYDPLNSFLKIK